MVAPEHDYLLGAGQLHGQDQGEHFDGEVTPVDIVPKEDVLGCLAGSADVRLEQFEEVVELSVDVADDGDGVVDGDEVGLSLWVRRGY